MNPADARWYLRERPSRHWMRAAHCSGRNPELWFSTTDGQHQRSKAARARTEHAKAICARCPVTAECLDYAIAIDARYGIWGGVTEQQRATMTGRRLG